MVIDFLRSVLNRSVFISIQGMTLPIWARLLWDNRGRVHPLFWPRALLLTITSLCNTVYAALDAILFGWRVRRVRVPAPLIILGHFRGGTTHLHNLLALDPRFAYPTLFQTMNPDGFLATEALFRLPTHLLLTKHRPQDDVPIDPAVPAEDEVALGIATGLSPYLGWVFPHRQAEYDRYLTFEEASPAEIRRWKSGLHTFLRKLTWKYDRPLILKSPPHTARIQLLLELFPDARFVHIHRDPYEVFQSTRRLLTKLPPYFALQIADTHDLDERILRGYERMYGAYFAQRDLIPEGQFHEVAFEDLERRPVETIAAIYRNLRLDGFDRVEPELRRYLASVASYRKNHHPDLPEPLRARIAHRWRRCFEAWGYPIDRPAGQPPHGVRRRLTPQG
jgi:hypothetical protein